MGQPSYAASNAIIFVTYGVFLLLGLGMAWRMRGRGQSAKEFVSGNGTQSAVPLALNFIASSLGAGVLFSYPELATVAGVQGLAAYAAASALAVGAVGAVGPAVRRRCPEGFVLTAWARQRYGRAAMAFLSAVTLATLGLCMVAELAALGQVVAALAGAEPLAVVVVECVVTTLYTSLGGFRVSFATDVVQASLVLALVAVAAAAVGTGARVRPELVAASGLARPSLLGWQLLYVLPVAVVSNDFFLSSLWVRAFASRSDAQLRAAAAAAAAVVGAVLAVVGGAGLVAVWSGAWPGEDNKKAEPALALFLLLERLPAWVVAVVLVLVVALSTAAFDSLQSAMVSSASNDVFGNRLPTRYVRALVVAVMVPVVVLALRAASILQIYLVSDLLSAATVPVLCLGLVDGLHWWRGFDVVAGGLGGLVAVFAFGAVYRGSAAEGARLLLLQQGLYAGDWSAFGAFVAAPVGGLVCGFAAAGLRLAFLYVRARLRHERFDALDRAPAARPLLAGGGGGGSDDAANVGSGDDAARVPPDAVTAPPPGKFF